MSSVRKSACRRIGPAIALALALSASAGSVLAQSQPLQPTANPSHAASMSAVSTRWSAPASHLIGMAVENRQRQPLGGVIDLLVDTYNNEVKYAIVSFGGVMNVGDKLFAFPLDRFERGPARDEDRLVLNVTRSSLESAPGFDRSLWPDFDRSQYLEQIERYYGTLRSSSDARYVRASEMLDGDVKDVAGNDIGDIHDLAVDLVHSSVHYVVLEFEDAWASRGELVAVPMQGMRSEGEGGTDLVYEASRQELVKAPSFGRDSWPEIIGNPSFQAEFDRYHDSWSTAPAS